MKDLMLTVIIIINIIMIIIIKIIIIKIIIIITHERLNAHRDPVDLHVPVERRPEVIVPVLVRAERI